MPPEAVTEALLARRVTYGESDDVCTLLTRDLGRVAAIARGARRSRRRFGAALGLFVVGSATVRRRGRGKLDLLLGFDCVEDLAGGIGGDVVKVAHGSYVLEVARESWPEGEIDPSRFDLVRDALRAIASGPPSASLLRAFELKLLAVAGVMPSLDRCVRCGRTIDPGALRLGFVATQGVVCEACGPAGWPVTREVLDALRAYAGADLAGARELSPPREVALAARDLVHMAIGSHLGREPRALAFLRSLAAG